jgi:hypothetical protein
LWYLQKALKELHIKQFYKDKLMSLSYHGLPNPFEIHSIKDFKDLTNRHEDPIRAQYINPFFQNVIDKHLNSNWVDIENYYFKVLLNFYGYVEQNILSPDYSRDPEVKKLNDCLDNIKEELIEYLKGIEITEDHKKVTINLQFAKEVSETKHKNGDSGNKYQILLLIFNYTSTIDLYKDMLFPEICQGIYIHGNINDIEHNPVIFGYGDESDIYYEKIERINSNEFLRNIKSSHYSKTRNYQHLSDFIDKEIFDVSIMGHSCGISDRVLLKSIFEHKNCRSIRIYYHKKSDSENDFFEKTQQLSRHFRAELKDKMRRMVIPFPDCMPLT